jgi:hypothetical protein
MPQDYNPSRAIERQYGHREIRPTLCLSTKRQVGATMASLRSTAATTEACKRGKCSCSGPIFGVRQLAAAFASRACSRRCRKQASDEGKRQQAAALQRTRFCFQAGVGSSKEHMKHAANNS